MTFIDPYSWKCLLGPQAKEITDHQGIYTWKVGKKYHLAATRQIIPEDLPIIKQYLPCNFNYMSYQNIEYLKQHFKIQKTSDKSVIIDLTKFSLNGGECKKTRQAVNKAKKQNLTVVDSFYDLKDIENLIEDWSTNYTDKYFRDFSGKNYYFYKNNFHQDCINIFIYQEKKLLAFSSLSPNQNGKSSYIIGKALYKKVPGISELADVLAFEKAIQQGVTTVNMGRAPKNLLKYKMKYPGSFIEVSYEGKII